jgi:hypothetical protein
MSVQAPSTISKTSRLVYHAALLMIIFWSSVNFSVAQNCNCDHTIATSQVAADGNTLHVQPGDTVCLEAGNREYLYLNNFNGDSMNRVVIINHGGEVIVQNDHHNYGIKTAHSSYFKLTGTGADTIQYGIKILQTMVNTNGVSFDEKSTNFEVDHLEIANTGFAGIMSKTDPKCDLSTNFGNFTQYDVIIHDNYIHNTGGEGMYVGHSSYSGYQTTCNGQPDTLYPHAIKGLRIFNNRVEETHLDGIQIGCADEDCEIYGNKVVNYGTDGNSAHTTGIQLGGGTTGKCYNNYIAGGKGSGIMVFGTGNIVVSNNVIHDAGLNYFPADPTKRVYGIFVDDRTTVPGRYFHLINNTIVNVKTDGIRFISLLSTNSQILNNIVIHPGSLGSYSTSAQSYINTAAGTSVIKTHNFMESNMNNVQFRDTLSDNFRLKSDSPLKDLGGDASSYGITFDYDSVMRPYYGTYDIGAYEQHPENTWTGGNSSSWDDNQNWSKANIPLPEDDVVIPAGTIYVPLVGASGMACNHLTVSSGAEILISPSVDITIYGNLTIEAGGALENSGTIYLKGNLTNLNP